MVYNQIRQTQLTCWIWHAIAKNENPISDKIEKHGTTYRIFFKTDLLEQDFF